MIAIIGVLVLVAASRNLADAESLAASDVENVLSRCCLLGSDWARQRSYTSCADFPAPVASVAKEHLALCISSADICCSRDNRKTQCKRGTNAALRDKRCSGNATELGEAYKDCCEACKLGLISGSLGEACHLKRFSFGLPWDEAFHECCAEAVGPARLASAAQASPSNDLTPSGRASPAANQTLCDLLSRELCAHLCVPTPGSFRCECHPGFALMSDGKSCHLQTEPDRCSKNNPCMHVCRDTGLAVECSCRPGYDLLDDRKTCSDIDECKAGTHLCDLKTQTCRNEQGAFTCLAKDGSVAQPPFDFPTLDNALPVGPAGVGRVCPLGYEYNSQLGVCDDVDECLLGGTDCRRPEDCVNTVGSFHCDGQQRGACPPGYAWDDTAQRCTDKDECEDGSNDCHEDTQFCLNSQGGFSCLERIQGRGSCPAGYKKDAAHRSGCKDVDECAERIHDCRPDAEVCRNTAGAYDCDLRCERGYRLDAAVGTCRDVDECTELLISPCGGSERCVNTIGSYVCVLPEGQQQQHASKPGAPAGR